MPRQKTPDILADLLGGQQLEPEPGQGDHIKATYYLPPSVLAKLDETWLRMRKQSGQRITRSQIVAAAMDLAMQDVERLTHQVLHSK